MQNPRWLLMFCITRVQILRSLGIYFSKCFQSPSNQKIKSSIFENVAVNDIVNNLQIDGLSLNINLPENTLKDILTFAHSAEYSGNANLQYRFYLSEKDRAEQRYQQTFFSAHHLSPAQHCKAIENLEKDPLLWEVASQYLETDPVLIGSRMWWTFATQQKLSESIKGYFQFHYDLEDYRFIKFMFYLTDVELSNAPHVCVKGSHRRKKLKHQFSLIRASSDREIIDFYSTDKIEMICGKAGFGFVEDFYCFHKALVPQQHHRLILEVKFAMHDYGLSFD